jgi:diacylglycerol kinase (ATP)
MKRFSIARRMQSVQYAVRGIRYVLRTQHNAWIHCIAAIGVSLAGFVFQINAYEWLAVVLSIMAVLTAEALNTAFEALCDVASPEFHPMVERAKDVAAGAVLIASIGAAVVGAIVFGPKLLSLGS